jgi:hypothetical protein
MNDSMKKEEDQRPMTPTEISKQTMPIIDTSKKVDQMIAASVLPVSFSCRLARSSKHGYTRALTTLYTVFILQP